MPTTDIEKQCDEHMQKAVEYLKDEFRGVRTGRATPALVEHLKVPVASYGSTMLLKELAGISTPEPTMILVKPFDPSTIRDIEKAIQASDIGITPQSEGKVIRLPVPPLSGERRQQITHQIKKMGEDQKVAIRNTRRDANRHIDAAQKDSKITEDQAEQAKDNVQKKTKKHEDQVEELVKAKTKEIEEV